MAGLWDGNLTLEGFYTVLAVLVALGAVVVIVTSFFSMRWAMIALYVVISLVLALAAYGDYTNVYRPPRLGASRGDGIFGIAYAVTLFNVFVLPFVLLYRWLIGTEGDGKS